MRTNILGICAGNGVSLFPFKDRLLGNIEPRPNFKTKDNKQWNLNFPKIPLDSDTNVRYPKGKVDIIIGHPDCGHSSVLAYSRAKKLSDPQSNESFNFFTESINYYEPKVFLFENLPNLLKNGFSLEDLFPNYHLKSFVESVSIWGNSQISRIRLITIGIHKDYPSYLLHKFRVPNNSHLLKTTNELIGGLTFPDYDLCHVRESNDTMISLYIGDIRKITVLEASKLWTNEYKGLKKWPVNRGNLKNQPGIYRNLGNLPPLSVTKSNRQFSPDGFPLTPRELARIQGIPDNFKLWFDKNIEAPYYCINKARTTVAKNPPYEIITWFHDVLNKLEPKLY